MVAFLTTTTRRTIIRTVRRTTKAIIILYMDQKTFEALKRVMIFARQHGADEVSEDFQQVLDWMDEVAKEVDEN